jgi:hypothetical protein
MLAGMTDKKSNEENSKSNAYKFEDAMNVADDIFKMNKEKEYHPGAFVHGLVFALETVQQSYKISPKQIADVKRGTRKYLQQVQNAVNQK